MNGLKRALVATCFTLMAVLYPPSSDAVWRKASVRILNVMSYTDKESVLVDADTDIQLGEPVQSALANGLPLSFEFTVQVRSSRWWWWDQTLASATRHLRIEYHELSRQYQVEDVDAHTQRTISDLTAALKDLGLIRHMQILSIGDLQSGDAYRARAKAELSVEEIPLPLRATSYLSADWHQESSWYTWSLR